MAIELALYQPEIARNVGLLIRLGACLSVKLHIIHPTGFAFSRRALRRGGLDYVEHADLLEHDSFARFDAWRREAGRRLVLLTTRASLSAYQAEFTGSDLIMTGRESSGVPEQVAEIADLRVRVPMQAGLRSLNVALAASLVIGEAKRQTGSFGVLT